MARSVARKKNQTTEIRGGAVMEESSHESRSEVVGPSDQVLCCVFLWWVVFIPISVYYILESVSSLISIILSADSNCSKFNTCRRGGWTPHHSTLPSSSLTSTLDHLPFLLFIISVMLMLIVNLSLFSYPWHFRVSYIFQSYTRMFYLLIVTVHFPFIYLLSTFNVYRP